MLIGWANNEHESIIGRFDFLLGNPEQGYMEWSYMCECDTRERDIHLLYALTLAFNVNKSTPSWCNSRKTCTSRTLNCFNCVCVYKNIRCVSMWVERRWICSVWKIIHYNSYEKARVWENVYYAILVSKKAGPEPIFRGDASLRCLVCIWVVWKMRSFV
jgi:hypothetical protein